jgi:hypothetical protein
MISRGIVLLSLGCVCIHVHSFSFNRRVGVITVTTPVSGALSLPKTTPRIYSKQLLFEGGTESDFVAPSFDEIRDKKAAEVFARPWFYYKDTGNPEVDRRVAGEDSSDSARKRERVFAGKTVARLLNSFKKVEDLINCFLEAGILNAETKVVPYTSLRPIEDQLDGQIICFGSEGHNELDVIEKEYVALASSARISDEAFRNVAKKMKRSPQVCFVLGSSGSGKTFFSVREAARTGTSNSLEEKSTTIYVQPGCTAAFAVDNSDQPIIARKDKATNLVDWIKDEIKAAYGQKKFRKVKMHVNLVLDEAGSASFAGYFADPQCVGQVLKKLRTVATSVWLVISGTGLDAAAFKSSTDAFKFRMKPWDRADLLLVLNSIIGDKKKPYFPLATNPANPAAIIDAVCSLSLYTALSANARTAHMMLDATCKYSGAVPEPESWILRLNEMTPVIVEDVVVNYIGHNALANLTIPQRRRVAASVLHAVDSARRSRSLQAPAFVGLVDTEEIACSDSLIESNVDNKGGNAYFVKKEEQTSILVSAALTIVCCSMLGIPVRVGSSFRVQELIASLFALCQKAIHIVEKCRGDLDSSKLDFALAELKIVQVSKPIPVERRDMTTISIPYLTRGEIWRNGENAPFADVVTEYVCFQTKRTEDEDKAKVVDLWVELEKCGLFRHQPADCPGRLALRGLFMVWQGKLPEGPISLPAKSAVDTTISDRKPSTSRAYPVNQLSGHNVAEAVTYLEIEREKIIKKLDRKRKQLPGQKVEEVIDEKKYSEWKISNGSFSIDLLYPDHALPAKLTFVILTNAEEITVVGPRNLKGVKTNPDESDEEEAERLANRFEKFKITAKDLSDGSRWGGRLDFESPQTDLLRAEGEWASLKDQWLPFQSLLLPDVEIVFLLG